MQQKQQLPVQDNRLRAVKNVALTVTLFLICLVSIAALPDVKRDNVNYMIVDDSLVVVQYKRLVDKPDYQRMHGLGIVIGFSEYLVSLYVQQSMPHVQLAFNNLSCFLRTIYLSIFV